MGQSKQQQGLVKGNPHRIGGGWADARQGAQRSRPVLRQHRRRSRRRDRRQRLEAGADGLSAGPGAQTITFSVEKSLWVWQEICLLKHQAIPHHRRIAGHLIGE